MAIHSNAMLSLPPTRVATPKPLYAQVRDLLMARIRSGEWAAGESLPNEHVLSSDFDVSIGTVRRAVAELEANGVLLRKQGRGTYVSGNGISALEAKFCAPLRIGMKASGGWIAPSNGRLVGASALQ